MSVPTPPAVKKDPPPGVDLFSQLLAFKWRNIEIPVTKTRMSLAHDLVEHKYWGVDGARVESTGIAPLRIHASAPMFNTIVPGKSESWTPGLYPKGFRALLRAFAERTSGILQHPEFGGILCRAERIEVEWDGNKRGGVECELSWIETAPELRYEYQPPSPVTEITVAAKTLDAGKSDLKKLVPKLPEFKTSFSDLADGLTAITDQAALLSARTIGKVDAILYRVQKMEDSINSVKSATTWAATHTTARIQEQAHDLRKSIQRIGRDILTFTVPADMTLALVLVSLPDGVEVSLGEILQLNPEIAREPIVKQGTRVRYYKPRVDLNV